MREIRTYGSMKGSRQALRSSRTHSAGLHGLWSLHKIWGGINRLAAEPVFLGLLTFIWLILPQFFLTIYIHHRKVPYQIHF